MATAAPVAPVSECGYGDSAQDRIGGLGVRGNHLPQLYKDQGGTRLADGFV
jgi:hypothetical protein